MTSEDKINDVEGQAVEKAEPLVEKLRERAEPLREKVNDRSGRDSTS
jgi:hypothetical protein